MKIGALGTGKIKQTFGAKLVQLGHDVMIGSRQEAHPNAISWAREAGHQTLYGTFYNAATFGEIIFNCSLGSTSLDALQQAGAENLNNKILIDTSNPLDYSSELWMLTVCNNDSLGKQIQRAASTSKWWVNKIVSFSRRDTASGRCEGARSPRPTLAPACTPALAGGARECR